MYPSLSFQSFPHLEEVSGIIAFENPLSKATTMTGFLGLLDLKKEAVVGLDGQTIMLKTDDFPLEVSPNMQMTGRETYLESPAVVH